MVEGMSIIDELCFNTLRIEASYETGEVRVGTGFLFAFDYSDHENIPVVVTNRHVVEGARSIGIQLTHATEDGQPEIGKFKNIIIEGEVNRWLAHPDSSVDLCVMPFGTILNKLAEEDQRFFFRTFSPKQLASRELMGDLSAIEDVVMVGYPIGLWDRANNMPIFRRGVTATRPDLDYEGRKEFMIDAACFPGSSGSPVIHCPTVRRTREGKNLVTTNVSLLGVLYAAPQHTVEGTLEAVPIPTTMQHVPVSKVPMNLGYVIKAERIMEFLPMIMSLKDGQS